MEPETEGINAEALLRWLRAEIAKRSPAANVEEYAYARALRDVAQIVQDHVAHRARLA